MSAKKRIGTRRRIDWNKIKEIRKVLQDCSDADLDPKTTAFYEYSEVSDATRLEHAAAHYPIFSDEKEIKADILRKHNEEVRAFNLSMENPKEQIIGVRYEFEDVHGKRFRMWFDEIAEGEKAQAAADKCDAYIKGWTDKKEKLVNIASDKELRRRNAAKRRAIKKMIEDRKSKKGKGTRK